MEQEKRKKMRKNTIVTKEYFEKAEQSNNLVDQLKAELESVKKENEDLTKLAQEQLAKIFAMNEEKQKTEQSLTMMENIVLTQDMVLSHLFRGKFLQFIYKKLVDEPTRMLIARYVKIAEDEIGSLKEVF